MLDYPIKRPQEETDCDQCGAPLRVGMIGVQREDDMGAVYCSEACADECECEECSRSFGRHYSGPCEHK